MISISANTGPFLVILRQRGISTGGETIESAPKEHGRPQIESRVPSREN